jgi:hypothetical protein
MSIYDGLYPADNLPIADIPGAIREKGRQLKEDGIAKPAAHKTSHATGGTDVITPADIGAETPTNAQSKVNTHAALTNTTHGLGAGYYFAKTTNSSQLLSWTEVQSKPSTFTPPIASATVFGGVKIGSGIGVDVNGVISTLPTTSHGVQVFQTSGTFVVPTGITFVFILVIAAGGSGGAGSTGNYSGGDGGAGESKYEYITGLTPGASIAVTIGVGGAAVSSYNSGLAGGPSSFGSYVSCVGGGGGGRGDTNSHDQPGATTGLGGRLVTWSVLAASGFTASGSTKDGKFGSGGSGVATAPSGRGGNGTVVIWY